MQIARERVDAVMLTGIAHLAEKVKFCPILATSWRARPCPLLIRKRGVQVGFKRDRLLRHQDLVAVRSIPMANRIFAFACLAFLAGIALGEIMV